MADSAQKLAEYPQEFMKEGLTFVKRCTKPTKKEYLKIIQTVGMGFVVMGAIGYIVKLIHIPIRHLITV
ncbi:uncharacterized protein V2V93DRAFT_364668 [Kockiozyma suomiensis]|uniref:uncharacterized protein n=1 Tax=Kockiozyma suomiensis TaxID=1337062 RepID=UPI0033430685